MTKFDNINNYHKDIRYKDIQRSFEKLFIMNNYSLGQKFDSTVWFLEEKLLFKNKNENTTNNSTSSNTSNSEDCMKVLISSLNEINQTKKDYLEKFLFEYSPSKKTREKKLILSNSQDFKIFVCDFISKICEALIYSQNIIDKTDENLRFHKGVEIKDQIAKKIKEIDLKQLEPNCINSTITLSKDLREKSSIIFSLSRLSNLPEGEYSFKLVMKEIDLEYNIISYEKKLLSNKKIKILTPFEKINLFQMNLNKQDVSFQEVFIQELNQEALLNYMKTHSTLRSKTIVYKEDNTNNNNIVNNSRKDIKSFTIRDSRRESSFNIRNSVNPFDSTTSIVAIDNNQIEISQPYHYNNQFNQNMFNPVISPKKRKLSKSQFDYSTITNYQKQGISTLQPLTVLIPTDFKFEENTGTNLISFNLIIERNGEPFGETEESFLDYLILHTNEICDLEKKSFSSFYSCNIKLEELVKAKLDMIEGSCSIIINIESCLDNNTKKSIMKRIYRLFEEDLILKKYHENVISNLLSYFPDVEDKIKRKLRDFNKDETEACCSDGCSIY